MPSAAKHAPTALWGVPYDLLTVEKKPRVYRWFNVVFRHHPEVDSCSTTTPFSKGNLHSGQNFRQHT